MRPAAAFLCSFILATLARAQAFQQWNEVDLTASWGKFDLLAPVLARTDSHLPSPQLAATGILADYPLPWHLTVTGGYLFADLPQRSDRVQLPLLALSKSFHLGQLIVTDRNRFEKLVGSELRRFGIATGFGWTVRWALATVGMSLPWMKCFSTSLQPDGTKTVFKPAVVRV